LRWEWRNQRPLCIIQAGWAGLPVHTNKPTQPFLKCFLREMPIETELTPNVEKEATEIRPKRESDASTTSALLARKKNIRK
jgi:hypothetical protein